MGFGIVINKLCEMRDSRKKGAGMRDQEPPPPPPPVSDPSYPGFCGIKRLQAVGVFLIPPGLDGMLVHRRVSTPSIKFAGTHLYSWVERGTVRVKCLAQEHNTVSLARQTARSRVKHTNHEATVTTQKVAF